MSMILLQPANTILHASGRIKRRTISLTEMYNLLETRKMVWRELKFLDVTREARTIALTGIPSSDPRVPNRKGVKDARAFLIGELMSGAFDEGPRMLGGPATELAGEVNQILQEHEEDRKHGTRTIKTGIPLIDEQLGGLDKRTLNLIMGHTGHRKTAVARTAAYYAALGGHRVLFIPLEWTVEEELVQFVMMHAHQDQMFKGTQELSVQRAEAGELNQDERDFVRQYIAPSFRDDIGKNLVIRGTPDGTWPAIKQIIESEHSKEPLAMVVIDYVSIISFGDSRDEVGQMNRLVKEIKQMALHHDGQGLVFLTPVQCNRTGYDKALANHGVWETAGIYLFSEMEKSADNIMYTFMPDELKQDNQMRIGFCKTRRHGAIEPRLVEVDPATGLVGGSPVIKKVKQDDSWLTNANQALSDYDRFYGYAR
jgi:hypothetical protein